MKRIRRQAALLLMAVVSAIVITACSDPRTYDHYEHTQLSGWERNDTLRFDVPPQWAGTYSLNIGLRATADYPFKNISLVMQRTVYPSRVTKRDIVSCRIISDNGSLEGSNGVSGSQIIYSVRRLNLHQGDSLHIEVYHNMRQEILPGISDVGVQLERLDR